jgi:hypothetical protein
VNEPLFVASVEQMVGELVLQVYVHRLRGGDERGARLSAERALERLLSRGLPTARGPGGALLLDPYATMNSLKARAGEPADEAWTDWVETARVNAMSLPKAPHRYRLTMVREWRLPAQRGGRDIVLRLPLPLRGSLAGTPDVRLLEPEGALVARRDEPGRVELRLDAAAVRGVARAEMTVDFVSGETDHVETDETPEALAASDDLWRRPVEGLIAPSAAITEFARGLPGGPDAPRELAVAAFDRLMSVLRLGDLHRDHLDGADRLGALLGTAWVDCALAANLFVAACRARGVPARIVSGFLLHRAFLAPHFWAEARLEQGRWVPFDLGGWDCCEGNPADPAWGGLFRGRVDARFLAEVAPRHFTGWGSARPPERWFRLFGVHGDGVRHTLHAFPGGDLFQGDELYLSVL